MTAPFAAQTAPSLMAIPRELREEILSYLVEPGFIYTSSASTETFSLYRSKKTEKTFVDTRIHLPSLPPANILATSKQLRDECLDSHFHLLNTRLPTMGPVATCKKRPKSSLLAERLGTEFDEQAERACDKQNELRVTLEVQRQQRSSMGYFMPSRDQLSPRFLALLPFMDQARKLRLVIWPGYDWWNGPPQVSSKMRQSNVTYLSGPKPDEVSVAIAKILERFSLVEELSVDMLIDGHSLGSWDLPTVKWERIQYWLDGPITVKRHQPLKKVHRRLLGVWAADSPELFYEQIETLHQTWHVKRRGDMRTVKQDMYFLHKVLAKLFSLPSNPWVNQMNLKCLACTQPTSLSTEQTKVYHFVSSNSNDPAGRLASVCTCGLHLYPTRTSQLASNKAPNNLQREGTSDHSFVKV